MKLVTAGISGSLRKRLTGSPQLLQIPLKDIQYARVLEFVEDFTISDFCAGYEMVTGPDDFCQKVKVNWDAPTLRPKTLESIVYTCKDAFHAYMTAYPGQLLVPMTLRLGPQLFFSEGATKQASSEAWIYLPSHWIVRAGDFLVGDDAQDHLHGSSVASISKALLTEYTPDFDSAIVPMTTDRVAEYAKRVGKTHYDWEDISKETLADDPIRCYNIVRRVTLTSGAVRKIIDALPSPEIVEYLLGEKKRKSRWPIKTTPLPLP